MKLRNDYKEPFSYPKVWVDCRGENPADVENMGEIEYFPSSRGFPSFYFPFKNQVNYCFSSICFKFSNFLLSIG